MRYALLMYADPERTKAMTADELDEVGRKHAALRDELVPAGVMVGGAGLVLPEETTTLRWEGPAGTGPLVAGRDQLTAYYEVECESGDQARDIAARLLDFHVVAVEVRRIHDRVDLQVPAEGSVRARLIDAAEDVMRRHGPLNVRIDEVARLAGCSRATVYRHVADKDELVREVLARLARARAEEMAPALARIEDPAERIAEGILRTLDAVRSEWWYVALARRDATAAVARLGGGPRAIAALTEPLVAPFVAGLAAEGRLRPGVTVADATEWLCVVTTGLLAAEGAEPDARPRDAQRAFLRRFVADPLLRRG